VVEKAQSELFYAAMDFQSGLDVGDNPLRAALLYAIAVGLDNNSPSTKG
jgi:hypothetical protein